MVWEVAKMGANAYIPSFPNNVTTKELGNKSTLADRVKNARKGLPGKKCVKRDDMCITQGK
jgi:hypothetical protein